MSEPSIDHRLLRVAIIGHVPMDDPHIIDDAQAEIWRLQDAKRRALAIADERGKENDRLRAALKQIVDKATWTGTDGLVYSTGEGRVASDALANGQISSEEK